MRKGTMAAIGTVLLAEPDTQVARTIVEPLEAAGLKVTCVENAADAMSRLADAPHDVLVSDIGLPDQDGLQLLAQVRQRWPEVEVVMLSSGATVEQAILAMKTGAADFLQKPVDPAELLHVINKGLVRAQRPDQPVPIVSAPQTALVGGSAALKKVLEVVQRAANGTATVLIRGESGTGKELVARALHDLSPRRDGPFIKVHSAALPDTLLESELFGYEKGAFTGATQRKPGRVELAEGGTLFLDEIGDVTPAIQVKLLRLLQDKQFERLGSNQTSTADVRFVAATHRDLESMMKRNEFRQDLFYRLNVVPLWLPPLRSRREDIAALSRHFVGELASVHHKGSLELAPEAIELLEAQRWPGNVRQLQNFLERLVVLSNGAVIDAGAVRRALQDQVEVETHTTFSNRIAQTQWSSEAGPLDEKLRDAERRVLVRALQQAENNRSMAARLLGVSRRTLYNKLDEHGLR
jgi:two-component system, NtrC family, response regulator AtoC